MEKDFFKFLFFYLLGYHRCMFFYIQKYCSKCCNVFNQYLPRNRFLTFNMKRKFNSRSVTDNKACNIYLKIIRSADQRSSISTHRSRYFTSCWWYKLWFSRFRFYYLRVGRLTSFKSFNPRQYVECLIVYIQNY